MIPTLLLPVGLLALAALALPLLLHLVRRDEQRPVDFAALRWLSARVRPRRSLRFEEWLLLALRLLIIALLALLLARPVLPAGGGTTPWIVAAPGVAAAALRDAAATTDGAQAERRWLAPGFPALDAADATHGPQPVASLLRELDMRMPAGAPLVVLVPQVLEGVDAERPRLSRPVDWRVLGAGIPPPSADAHGGARDTPPRLQVRGDGTGARYLRAAFTALQDDDADPAEGAEIRAWLTPGALPAPELAWVEAGGTLMLGHDAALPSSCDAPGLDAAAAPWSDDDGRPLLRASRCGSGRILQWARPLQPAAMPVLLEPGFPRRLLAVLQPSATPARVLAAEHAPLAGDVGPWPAAVRELSPWLALAIALLFLLERWLAAGPRQGRRT